MTESLQPLREGQHYAAYLLPDVPWARRVSGIFANKLANDTPSRAHAVVTPRRSGSYSVNVRAPIAHPEGADVLCLKFESGGGRRPAAGINRLPRDSLDQFLAMFSEQFG